MVRASSRSAVSHLHVVATQSATTSDDAPLHRARGRARGARRGRPLPGRGRRRGRRARGARGLGKTALLEHAALSPATPAAWSAAPRPGRSSATSRSGWCARCSRRRCARPPRRSARSCSTARRGVGRHAAARGHAPSTTRRCASPTACCGCARRSPSERPLALVIDDAQWADRSSLEVLAYLARRIDDLPLLIAVAARVDDPRAPSDLLSLLGGVRSATVLHPSG